MAAAFALYLRASCSIYLLKEIYHCSQQVGLNYKKHSALILKPKLKWLDIKVSEIGQVMIEAPTVCNFSRMNLKLYYGEVLVKSMTNTPKETKYNTFINCLKRAQYIIYQDHRIKQLKYSNFIAHGLSFFNKHGP